MCIFKIVIVNYNLQDVDLDCYNKFLQCLNNFESGKDEIIDVDLCSSMRNLSAFG